ncbi:MAG: hypothetical protein MUR51_04925 [Pseudomonadota bacterium]|nr:hypothetical protein [Pseudomonadota bacterium]
MNKNRPKMRGSISLLAIAGIVTTALAGSYFYLDSEADSRATATMISLVDEAQSQGMALSYSSVDASPLTQTVEITDFSITGNEQEANIHLGNIVMTGFSWQDLNNNQNKLPQEMSINIKHGELHLKRTMLETSTSLQSLVSIFGDTIPFSTKVTYKLDPTHKLLKLSLTQTVEENFFFDSEATLGHMDWLTKVERQQTQIPAQAMSEAMNSTLNSLSITYKNTGLIEKIRADISRQTGKTNEQLTQESIEQLQQLQMTAAQHWGPVLTPLIDEMIKFSSDPKQLKLDVAPVQPLTGQYFMMAFIGGEANLIKLIEDAQIRLKAN